jgi:hypothetical protein
MKQTFVNGKESENIQIISETKKYIIFRNLGNQMKYRYNKIDDTVSDGTYNKTIIGMKFEL